MVARDQINRHGQRRQQSIQVLIFNGPATVDEMPRDDHNVRKRTLREDVRYAAPHETRSVDLPIGELAGRPDMQIANLANEHWMLLQPQ